jgi:hypothetical protein
LKSDIDMLRREKKNYTEMLTSLEEQIAKSKHMLAKCNNLNIKPNTSSFYKSIFRNNVFKFADPPLISNPILESKKGTAIRFCDLCAMVRSYIYQNNLLTEDGTIKCDSFLKSIVENSETTTFFKIVAGFRRILV